MKSLLALSKNHYKVPNQPFMFFIGSKVYTLEGLLFQIYDITDTYIEWGFLDHSDQSKRKHLIQSGVGWTIIKRVE